MNNYDNFDFFKNSLLLDVYGKEERVTDSSKSKKSGGKTKVLSGKAPKFLKSKDAKFKSGKGPKLASEYTAHEKIQSILENNIIKSKNYLELETNIQSAVKKISEISDSGIPNSLELHKIKSIALNIQEKVAEQIQSVEKEGGTNSLTNIDSGRIEIDDRLLSLSPMKKIDPRVSIDSLRQASIRNASREMYYYSLAFSELHHAPIESKARENWLTLVNYIHEKTFKDYSYEVHYLDIKTGKDSPKRCR